MEDIKAPEVIWVDSWRDIPETDPNNVAHRMTRAAYFNKENVIYAVRGKATQYDLAHEECHAKITNDYVEKTKLKKSEYTREQILEEKRQKEFEKPRYGIEDDIKEEFQCHKYAYDKTGKPKHLDHQLAAMYDALTDTGKPSEGSGGVFVEVKPSEAMRWLRKYLLKVKPPEEWVEDIDELEEWYHEEHAKNKNKTNSIYYGDKEYHSEKSSNDLVSVRKPEKVDLWYDDKYFKKARSGRQRRKSDIINNRYGMFPILDGKL